MNPPTLVEHAPLSFGLFAMCRTMFGYGTELLLRLGLYPGQELILMRLYDADGQTQSDLQASLGSDHSTISRSIRRMEEAGLVTRSPADHDRRAMVVSLTDAGRALRPGLTEMWGTMEAALSGALTEQERTDLPRTVCSLHRALASARAAG
ncbi:MarR family winged helix-turn-helix transcriptional regulator [Cryptosporangium arvum]|uniref:MarR family winged helix-turn-helix transcriptional regulator n=1 Tax=Cryptosporangium arvum TaxID=80871 RepID=UPI0004B0745C|nr:MarR family transcriptional regulator [Cryptosporangium arvum]